MYASLRNDDSIWDSPSAWRTAGGECGFLYGTAHKTKATEATSTRLSPEMPWSAPLRGVCTEPSRWAQGYLEDCAELGIADQEYAVPAPWAARAGLTPPGATEPDEWVTQIRVVLQEAGIPREQAAGISLHSGKKTALTWAGTSGKFSEADLAILGHHRSAGVGKCVRAYNMSELSAPMAQLASLLEDIAAGKFHPDAPPGLQWGPAPQQPLPLQLPARPGAGRGPSDAAGQDMPAASPRQRQARRGASAPAPGTAPDLRVGPPREIEFADEAPKARLGFLVSDHINPSRPRYVHEATIAPKADSKRRRTARLRVQTPHGVVTTLCDNTLQSASWSQECPRGADLRTCPVCRARAANRRGGAP